MSYASVRPALYSFHLLVSFFNVGKSFIITLMGDAVVNTN